MLSGSHEAHSDPRFSGTPAAPMRRSSPVSLSRRIYDGAALLLLLASSVAGIWLYGAVRFWSIGPLMLSVCLAGILYFARPLIFRSVPPLGWPPAILGLCAFLLYGFIRIPSAAVPHAAQGAMLVIASAVLAYVVWSGLACEERRWRWLLALLFLSITVMAWYAIIQNAHDSNIVLGYPRPDQYGMRASGAYFCPNHFANVLAATLPMAVAIAAMPAARAPLRLLAGYSVLVILPPLYLSGSRSAWLGVLAGLLVVLTLLGLRRSFRRALFMLLIAALSVAVVGLLAWFLLPLVQTRVADALKGNVRLFLWRDTLDIIRAQPWFGFGPGSYRWVYPKYWHHLTHYIDPEFAHNDYLQLLAEFGIVGALVLVGSVGWLVVRLVRSLRNGDTDRSSFMIAGFVGALTAYGVHAAFDYNFHIYSNVHVLIAFAGITAALLRGNGGTGAAPRVGLQGGGRWRAAWALLPLLLALFTARALAGYTLVQRGDVEREASNFDEAVAAYRRALRLEPGNGDAHRGIAQCLTVQAFWNLDPETKRVQAEEARAEYWRALACNSWDVSSRLGLSRAYSALDQPEEALDSLRALVEMIPHEPGYKIELGLQLRAMQRYGEALEVFEALQKTKNTEQVRLNIAFLRRKLAE